jgi:cyclic beta-1,2-glucan synthetase
MPRRLGTRADATHERGGFSICFACMTVSSNVASTSTLVRRAPLPSALLGTVLAAAAIFALVRFDGALQALVPACLAPLAVAFWSRGWLDRHPTGFATLLHAAVAGAFGLAIDPAATIWQMPTRWLDLVAFTEIGAACALGVYLGAIGWIMAAHAKHLRLEVCFGLFLLPYLLNGLFLLAAPGLMQALGAALAFGLPLGPAAEAALGRALVLSLFNLVFGLGFMIDRRATREPLLFATLVAAAVLAAATPLIADLAVTPFILERPRIVAAAATVAITALAQAGLWGQTFLATGILLDALHRRRPTGFLSRRAWPDGMRKGAVYGGVFMAIVHVASLLGDLPLAQMLWRTSPIVALALAAMLAFPLIQTIVESFDGSAPFHHRLLRNLKDRRAYARGLVVGAGIGLFFAASMSGAGQGTRFIFGFLVGALAYAAVDAFADIRLCLVGERTRLQSWRVYGLGMIFGGIVGGAIAWYFDAPQLAAVGGKFQTYATFSFAALGQPVPQYVVYPLFSKWGATDLGLVGGGAKLLYAESLSGVINWSLAAPLFSVNFVLLAAAVERSLDPFRRLASQRGMLDVLEQTVRVLRWGLWMAPVIYSFLRLAPDPTWYNQDGAVRTVLATWQSFALPADEFRQWSLQLFLGLLAYDWLRILIWFDHMGLRVATLVNLSFIGGDAADEKAARFLGHSARTRAIPEAIRRFATWAPLLIPFYIPRGAEWDLVWNEASAVRAAQSPLLPSVAMLLNVYLAAAALVAIVVVAYFLVRNTRNDGATRARLQSHHAPPALISNGLYTVEGDGHGHLYARVLLRSQPGREIDVNRRVDDPLREHGKQFYLRERLDPDHPLALVGRIGSCEETGGENWLRLSPTRLRRVVHKVDLRIEIDVELGDAQAIERWHVRIANLLDRARSLELTSYQEWALNGLDAYQRQRSYNALHIATYYAEPGIVLAQNRLLMSGGSAAKRKELPIAFHAFVSAEGGTLSGYEDSRRRFIGNGSETAPDALAPDTMQTRRDQGLAYTFDPIASLSVALDLPANGALALVFVDGFAQSAAEAAALLRGCGVALDTAALAAALKTPRALRDREEPRRQLPYAFAEDGRTLHIKATPPRSWAHVIANPLGSGLVVSHDGGHFSFARNAQQNGLTPFTLDVGVGEIPGRRLYAVDTATCAIHVATARPEDWAARRDIEFAPGLAVFRSVLKEVALEQTMFVAADEAVEFTILKLRNRTDQRKRMRIVSYAEMMLAELVRDSIGRLEIRREDGGRVLLFRNPGNDFVRSWVYVTTSFVPSHVETKRAGFIGRQRDLDRPFMAEHGLADADAEDDGRVIAGFAGMVDVAARGEVVVSVVMGEAASAEEALAAALRVRTLAAAEQALAEMRRFWTTMLDTLHIETDDSGFDRMVNTWLPYQVLAARLWGRTGPQQRSGAFGFRDQLQDVLPLILLAPEIARAQILLHAKQQFLSGDVLQWWHQTWEDKTGIGARNRASDPQLWLPYLLAHYIEATGDASILQEEIPFLEGKPIPPGAEGIVIAARPSRDHASLREHCRRAIALTLGRRGAHGLPLMGTGDWNDGLDGYGAAGKGESLWLGFMLHFVLVHFAPFADQADAERYRREAASLHQALESFRHEHSFPRALADDGTVVTFADALTAAWPVMAGVGEDAENLAALEKTLAVLEKEHCVLLLSPPFTEGVTPYPGRIAKYPPGVRENGGQYSHGSSWLIDAYALLADRAAARGETATADRLRDRAFGLWHKISPLGNLMLERIDRYGLPPHQQPADISYGPGYEERGGWSWYTGSAARMLSAAYAVIGIAQKDGVLHVPPSVFAAGRRLRVKRLRYRGRVYAPPSPEGAGGDPSTAPERSSSTAPERSSSTAP